MLQLNVHTFNFQPELAFQLTCLFPAGHAQHPLVLSSQLGSIGRTVGTDYTLATKGINLFL